RPGSSGRWRRGGRRHGRGAGGWRWSWWGGAGPGEGGVGAPAASTLDGEVAADAKPGRCVPLRSPSVPSDHFAGVTVVAQGQVGRLRLDRPDGRSVLAYPLLGGLVDAARWFDERPDV